jgi:hypothetical protein
MLLEANESLGRETYISTGSGAFGAGGGAGFANMLAQLFFTPSGMMLDATFAATAAVEGAASAVVEPHPGELSSVGFAAVSQAGVSVLIVVSHPLDSAVGIDDSTFSLWREPFVCAADAPRALPLLLRSLPRPRPPLPASNPARPPRESREVWVGESLRGASLTLDLDRSFFVFETSPHCVMEPRHCGQFAVSARAGSRVAAI